MQTLVATLVDLTDVPAKATEHNAWEWTLLFVNFQKAIILISKVNFYHSLHQFHNCRYECSGCSLNYLVTRSSMCVLREMSWQ